MTQPQAPTPPPRCKWPFVVLGILVLFIILVLSTNGGGGTVTTLPVATSTGAVAAGASTDSGNGSQVATFGQRFTWPDGLAVTASKPQPFNPSSSAADNTRGRAVLITTTVTNGTTQPYMLNPFIIGPRATQAGQEAPQIFDSAKNVSVFPATTLLPGKSYTFKTAFSVGQAVGELQLEYSEDTFGSPAIFTGQG